MSNDTEVAIILSCANKEVALKAINKALYLLVSRYSFGFRSYGGVYQLLFEDGKFFAETPIEDNISSASLINLPVIKKLESDYGGFSINGSIRLTEVDHLVDLDIICLPFPNKNDQNNITVVFRIEEDIYWKLWNDNELLNESIKEALLTLVVDLGANSLVDAFHARLLVDISDVQQFDAIKLYESLLQPTSIIDMKNGTGLVHGFITGIKTSFITKNKIKNIWKFSDKFETPNGFYILNDLID